MSELSLDNISYAGTNYKNYITDADKSEIISSAPAKSIIQAGFYVIDLSPYGTGSSGTLTYNIKSICRLYGLDYTSLTINDFAVGVKAGYSSTTGPWSDNTNVPYLVVGTPSPSYDASTGTLTVSGLYASGGMAASYKNTVYWSTEQVLCYLIPQSVIVD